MPRILAILLFLMLVGEHPQTYSGLLRTPLGYVDELIHQGLVLKVPFWTYAQIVFLLALGGTGRAPHQRAAPMDLAILVGMATIVVWIVIGIARGAGLQDCGFQTLTYLDGLMLALLIMALMRKPHHYGMILKAVVAAAAWRASMAIFVYLFIVQDLPKDKVPDYMTDHQDSALFVSGLVIVVVAAVERVTKDARRIACVLAPILLMAMHVNNRRLAWVSLVGGLLAAYAALAPGEAKRRVNRAARYVLPVVAVYVAVGWGRPEPVFEPLAAFSSVSSHDNMSTRSRDNENDGLVFTLGQYPVLGMGFGHEYLETDTTLSARGFQQYRLVPHNSVLGLLTFTGIAGFIGIMLPLAVSVFLNARTCRTATEPIARVAAIVGVAEVAICMNQWYGDMGFGSRTTLAILATALATAGRLSAWSGGWPSAARAPVSTPPAAEGGA